MTNKIKEQKHSGNIFGNFLDYAKKLFSSISSIFFPNVAKEEKGVDFGQDSKSMVLTTEVEELSGDNKSPKFSAKDALNKMIGDGVVDYRSADPLTTYSFGNSIGPFFTTCFDDPDTIKPTSTLGSIELELLRDDLVIDWEAL